MTDQPFEPENPADATELGAVEARLIRERPIPAPGFRGELARRLATERGGVRVRARRLVLAYATSGLALFAVATAGVAGLGPLA